MQWVSCVTPAAVLSWDVQQPECCWLRHCLYLTIGIRDVVNWSHHVTALCLYGLFGVDGKFVGHQHLSAMHAG